MATRPTQPAPQAPNYLVPFITVTALFGIFGFLTNMNSNLSPKLQDLFHLNHAWSNLVATSWFLAYLIFSVPSAKLIEAVGYKRTMVISLFVMMIGALLFVPAANMISFPLFLAASFVLATGVTALQTSANPYVSILGPEHTAPARLTLAQAFNSLGAALAPLVVVHFILSNPAKVSSAASTAHTVEGPYVVIAAALLLLGVSVMFMHLPAITATREFRPAKEGKPITERNIWTYSHTVLGMVGIFFYVGIEIALAANAIKFFNAQGIFNGDTIAFMALLYYLLIGAGRFIGTILMKWVKAQTLLGILGFCGVALLLVAMTSRGMAAAWMLVLCGLANSIMYPTIFALGIAELGPLTSAGSGVITIGNVGGAVIPLLFGAAADRFGFQYAFIVIILCYLYVSYYGLSGCKPRRRVTA
ncbi:MAG TPA: sugar MFS transporter [Terracidiphilus sp.]|nr:sugar MFS transporter [Terracidiphilus sp.]